MATSADMLNDIKQLLPTVFIEQITLDSITKNSKEGFRVELEGINLAVDVSLSLKDIQEKDGISQWFADKDLQKYINMNVCLTTSEADYSDLFNAISDVKNDYTFVNSLIDDRVNKKTMFRNSKGIPSLETLKQNKGIFYSENYIKNNDDGTNEITIPINSQFRLNFEQTENSFLGILTFLTFNLSDFAANFGINDIEKIPVLSRSVTCNTIIKNGKVVSELEYFLLPDGKYYYGQFHKYINPDNKQEEYKTGLVETIDSQVLELVTDKNNIISDLRIRDFFEDKKTFDETGILNKTIKNDLQIKQIIEKNKSPKEYSKYFSDTFISLDEQGNCRFSFFFDKYKFALDNFFYPQIINPSLEPSLLAKEVKVKNISVYRIRKDLKEINDSSENIPVLIANNSISENSFDTLNPPDLTSFNGSYVMETNVEGLNQITQKNYSVRDTYVSSINYGLYKYKIGMEIIDPTKKLLEDQSHKTDEFLAGLQIYLGNSLGNKKIKEQLVGDLKQKQVKYVPYFDNLLGKFIPDFLNDYEENINSIKDKTQEFFNDAKKLGYYSEQDLQGEENTLTLLLNLVTPPAATPDSIQLMIKIVQNFLQKLQSLLNVPDTENNSKASNKNNIINFEYDFEKSLNNNLGQKTEYTYDKVYDSYFNAAVVNGAGFKIIKDITATNNLGLNSVNLSDFKKTTDFAVKKHFNDFTNLNIQTYYGDKVLDIYNFEDQFSNDNSKFSYLPIFSIGTINKKYEFSSISDQFSENNFYKNIFLDILNYNTIKQANFSIQDVDSKSKLTKEEQTTKGQLLDLFNFVDFSGISLSQEEPISEAQNASINRSQSLYDVFGRSSNNNSTSRIDQQISNNKSTSLISDSDINSNPSSLLIDILLHEILGNVNTLNLAKNFSIFCPVNEEGEKNPNYFLDKVSASTALSLLFSADPETALNSFQNYIRNLPIPIKHLIISRGDIFKIVKVFEDTNFIKDATIYPENFFKYWINFKKIYEIQYLDGFVNGDLKSPVWKTLNINKLTNSKSKIMCRIQNYKLPDFEEYFPDVQKLEMPVFDKYFYIIPDNSVDLLSSIQNAISNVPKPKDPPPLRRSNPPPDKVGPISDLSLNLATRTARETEVVSTSLVLGPLASTVIPIYLQDTSTRASVDNKTEVQIPTGEQQRNATDSSLENKTVKVEVRNAQTLADISSFINNAAVQFSAAAFKNTKNITPVSTNSVKRK